MCVAGLSCVNLGAGAMGLGLGLGMVGCRNRSIAYRCTASGGLGPDDSAYEGDTDAALMLEPASQMLLTTSSDASSLEKRWFETRWMTWQAITARPCLMRMVSSSCWRRTHARDASASTLDACSSSETFLRSVDASALSVLDRCSTWAAARVARSAVSASQEGH